jgi:ankyrin repeat protein
MNEKDILHLIFDHGINPSSYNFPKQMESLEGMTPLHYAAKIGCYKSLLAIISRGVEIDPKTEELKTPLVS